MLGGVGCSVFCVCRHGAEVIPHWTTLVHRLGFIEAIAVSVGSDLYSPAKQMKGSPIRKS